MNPLELLKMMSQAPQAKGEEAPEGDLIKLVIDMHKAKKAEQEAERMKAYDPDSLYAPKAEEEDKPYQERE